MQSLHGFHLTHAHLSSQTLTQTNTHIYTNTQTYLEQNEGPGLQHLALKTNDILHTVGQMAQRSHYGGFEFMPRPSEGYYSRVAAKVVSWMVGWLVLLAAELVIYPPPPFSLVGAWLCLE